MAYEKILVETEGRVGIVTFNNQERLNALHPVMMAEMRSQMEAWNTDPAIGAIIVTGAGRAFCSGADMGGWQRGIEQRETDEPAQPRTQGIRIQERGHAPGAGLHPI